MSSPDDDARAAPTPPPPSQPAAEAARAAVPDADAGSRGVTDTVDDTGVPALVGDVDDIGRGFLSALFDISFTTFITRRLASAFYVVGLIAIGIGFIAAFLGGLIGGIRSLWWNPGGGIALIVSTVIVAPILAFVAVVVLRFVIESVVALIAIAENTERTAQNTRDD